MAGYILFYTPRCGHCKRFAALLGAPENADLKKQFQFVNIDVQPVNNIQYVPTVLDQATNNTYVGSACFKWLEDAQSTGLQCWDFSRSTGELGWSGINDNNALIQHQEKYSQID